MTGPSFAQQLAPLLGTRSDEVLASSLNGINLEDWEKSAIAIALTQGIEEIFALGPVALSEQRLSMVLHPPTNVSFTATQYSATISAFSGWQSWMEGCTIQGGDGEDNELLSATELLRPYMAGSASNISATVYGDAIRLPAYVKNTIDPVESPRVKFYRPAGSREDFLWYNNWDGNQYSVPGYPQNYSSRNKTSGLPCVYFVEPRYDPESGALPLFMRFNPMPDQAYPVTFRAKRKPPTVTVDDLSESLVTVTGGTAADGVYTFTGVEESFSGAAMYVRFGDDPLPLRYVATDWFIGDPDAVHWLLTRDSTAPDGTYSPGVGAVGNPVVTSNAATNLVVPTDWHESILLPFAKRWMMSHPAFNNPSCAQNIMDQYRMAKATLESFTPQISRTMADYR